MKSNNSLYFFWISPVLGLFSALKNLKAKHSMATLFMFCLCFGFCFSVGTIREEVSADGISMRLEFEQNKNISSTQFTQYLSDYFEFDKGAQDIYIVSMSYFVSRITNNYHFFFLALAVVFAFFQLKCLRYFVKEYNYRSSIVCLILTCLFLWNNIYNINGARFCTASWIGLYTVFKIFYDKKPLYILLALCLPMIHASFAIFPIIILFAFLIKNYRKPLIILFCLSWIFSVFASDFNLISFDNLDLPFLISKKVEAYTDKDAIAEMSKGSGYYWVGLFFKSLVRHYIDIIILLIALNEERVKNKKAIPIIRFMLFLAIFANFGMFIPILGARFFAVNYSLVAYSFLVTFGTFKYKILVYILPFVWFMNLYSLCKDVIDVLDLGFLLTPIFSFIRYLFV